MLAGIIMLLILYDSSFDNDAVDMNVNSKSNRHEETQDSDSRYFTMMTGESTVKSKSKMKSFTTQKKRKILIYTRLSAVTSQQKGQNIQVAASPV